MHTNILFAVFTQHLIFTLNASLKIHAIFISNKREQTQRMYRLFRKILYWQFSEQKNFCEQGQSSGRDTNFSRASLAKTEFECSVESLQNSSLQVLHLKTGWEGLPELVGLLLVVDDESVEVATAAHLELDAVLVLLYLHRFGIGSPGSQEEILDLHDLLRHFQASCCRISEIIKTKEL